ncbi:MAG: 2-oxoacid:ferredoxin oxidoreductase subunit beta [bacterium]
MSTSFDSQSIAKFDSHHTPQWCPGCGDFGILTSLKMALAEVEKDSVNHEDFFIVSGIGCSGKLPHYVKTYGFESVHGRVLPVVQAAKLANHKLTIIGVGGDGDGFGIGMCHFMHVFRRNMDVTYIVHDNQIYGLTKGQYSPTTEKGTITKSSPHGALEHPINPVASAIIAHATYVARGFAGDAQHLKKLIVNGIKHKGTSFIDILQPCVTWNKTNTYEFFRDRVYKLEEEKSYDPANKMAALKKADEWGKKIPIGLFFKKDLPTYESQLPQLNDKPLVEQFYDKRDMKPFLEKFY